MNIWFSLPFLVDVVPLLLLYSLASWKYYTYNLADCKYYFHQMTKKDSEDLGDLISISEAARLRDVSHAAIQDLIRRGKLSPVGVGGRRFVRRSDIENFQPDPIGRPPKQVTAAPPTTKSEIRSADKIAQKLNQAFRKAAEDGQQAGKKKGKK